MSVRDCQSHGHGLHGNSTAFISAVCSVLPPACTVRVNAGQEKQSCRRSAASLAGSVAPSTGPTAALHRGCIIPEARGIKGE